MTSAEAELNIKFLKVQAKIVRLEQRLEKVEAVLDAICIGRTTSFQRFGMWLHALLRMKLKKVWGNRS